MLHKQELTHLLCTFINHFISDIPSALDSTDQSLSILYKHSNNTRVATDQRLGYQLLTPLPWPNTQYLSEEGSHSM